ncbi:MAG: AbrB/MazE/SpoVT family DNA-binding domain-containing protein [Monoglobales bacterium]
MKSTGIVRRIDQLGRIVVPKELRRALNIVEVKDLLEIYLENGSIILEKIKTNQSSGRVSRKVDQLGRIVLPVELRRNVDIVEEKDSLEIFIDGEKIILKKYHPACVFCSDAKNIFSFKGKNICTGCLEELKEG